MKRVYEVKTEKTLAYLERLTGLKFDRYLDTVTMIVEKKILSTDVEVYYSPWTSSRCAGVKCTVSIY